MYIYRTTLMVYLFKLLKYRIIICPHYVGVFTNIILFRVIFSCKTGT